MAAATVTITATDLAPKGYWVGKMLTLDITAASTDGSVPSTTLGASKYDLKGLKLVSIETDPGTTAPTDNYDIALNDANGADVLATQGQNKSTSTTQLVAITAPPIIKDDLAFVLTNNSVNSATLKVYLIFLKP